MVLPSLKQDNSVIILQRMIHKGQLFSAIHNGNSTIALDDKFALKFTRVNDNFINIDLIRYGINAKAYSNIQFRPKAKKKKVMTERLEIDKSIKQEELL